MSEMQPLTTTSDLSSGIAPMHSGNFSEITRMFVRRGKMVAPLQPDLGRSHTINPMYLAPSYTKDPAGMEIARHSTGMGQFVMDPMQSLEKKVDINHPGNDSVGPAPASYNTLDSDAIRKKAVSAYKKKNK